MMTMNKTSLLFYLFLGEALAFVPQQQVAPTLRTNPCLSMPNAVDSSSQAATNEASQEFGVNPQQAHKNKTRLAWKLAKKDLDVARRIEEQFQTYQDEVDNLLKCDTSKAPDDSPSEELPGNEKNNNTEFVVDYQKMMACPSQNETLVQNIKPITAEKAIRVARLTARMYGAHAVETREAWQIAAELTMMASALSSHQNRKQRCGTANSDSSAAGDNDLSLTLKGNLIFTS